jgi:4-hydroxy-4-methyl-2-oxoglutarate aldolase
LRYLSQSPLRLLFFGRGLLLLKSHNKNEIMDLVDLLNRLQRLDVCAVCDALDSVGVPGYADGLVRRSTVERLAGRVRTMKLAAGKPPGGSTTHLGTNSIEEAGDTDVIVVEQRTGSPAACWGGVLSEAAHHKHIRGVIVDGPVRDIDEINETGLPVFSRAVSALSARGRIHETAVNVPIQVGDLAVEPGDLVIGDGSGVAFIPAAIAADVIMKAEEIAARERDMVAKVHENRSISEIMDKKYETLLGTQE